MKTPPGRPQFLAPGGAEDPARDQLPARSAAQPAGPEGTTGRRQPSRHDPHRFSREADGSTRVRLRLKPELASDIEVAAGAEPVLDWMRDCLLSAAERQVRRRASDAERA